MKILAFLQSPGHPIGTPQEVIDQYQHNQIFHRRLLAKSMSGNRLFRAFGSELYDIIIWDNASPINDAVDPDLTHMVRAIERERPDVILAFGGTAIKGLSDIITYSLTNLNNVRILHSPHPNSYGITKSHFEEFGKTIKRLLQYAS